MPSPNDHGNRVDESRRSFLAKTIAVGAAAAAVGSVARADRRARWGPKVKFAERVPVDAGAPIRIGVIGTGGMGSGHCRAIISLAKAGHENVQLVAISDVCDERLENARTVCSEEQGIEVDTYRDYVEMLARDDVHGVLIATPEHWHGQMARDAVIAGKDVYVETPMTLRLDDALHLREVVRASADVVCQIGTQKLMLPKWREARRLISEDAIGKPTLSQTSYCRNSMNGEWLYDVNPQWEPGVNLDWQAWCGPLGPAPWNPEIYGRWRRYKKYSTGIIGDLLVHQMTPIMYALDAGWPIRVVASANHVIDKAMENHDQININVEFENDHTMIVAGSTCNEAGLETMIRGHHANLYLGGRHVDLRPERIFADDIDPLKVECEDIGNDQDALRLDWLGCIRSREQPASGIDLATQVMVIVDLATRSAWDGRAWAFDPERLMARPV
jgi:predicted dehydrogenase